MESTWNSISAQPENVDNESIPKIEHAIRNREIEATDVFVKASRMVGCWKVQYCEEKHAKTLHYNAWSRNTSK